MKHENILGNFYTTLLKSTVTLQHEKVKFQRNHRHLVRCRSGSHQHHGALDTSARGHRRDSAHPHRPVPAVHRDADWHQREAGEAAAGSGSASDGKDNGLNRFADAMRTRCIFLEAASDHERQEYRPNGIRAISRTEGAPCNENPRDGIRKSVQSVVEKRE